MMTVLHILLALTALILTVTPGLPMPIRLLSIPGLVAVPMLAVIYRVTRRGGSAAWLPSIALYMIYFFARAWGLLVILTRRLFGY